MTRQLISTNKQPLLRSSHAKRPPQNGFVQVAKPEKSIQMDDLGVRTKPLSRRTRSRVVLIETAQV